MAAQERDIPKIVLIPHSRSHPFAQRECLLTDPQKVGRPVDKKKISQNNLIFDCRVLSRNHALIWFENGKFYIRDTKSSNGTFVNDCRLSPSGEESPPKELKTRDVIQFGVNVNVEKRGELGVTHGCIIASVKLFINDIELPGPDPDIQQVMQIIQNSLVHEQELETKLAYMQEVLVVTHSIAKDSMISIVKEDELLSRLEMLENQLQVCSRNTTENDLQKQLKKTLEDKHKLEMISKEQIQKLLQEKIDSTAKLSQLQRDYDKAEEECQRYRTLYESLKQEHSQQVCKLSESVKAAEKSKTDLEIKIKSEKDELIAMKESLKVDLDFTRNELESTKSKLKETNKKFTELLSERQSAKDSNLLEISIDEVGNDSSYENGEVDERITEDIETVSSLYNCKSDLKVELKASEDKVKHLTEELENLNLKNSSFKQEINELKDKLQMSLASEEEKTKLIVDLKLTIEEQKQELENFRSQLSKKEHLDVGGLPNALEQYQILYQNQTNELDKNLRERENELLKVKEEKRKVQERLLSLEDDHSLLIKENQQREAELQSELLEVQSEAKSLTKQLHQLKETLAETMANSISTSSSEISILEGAPHPDPRLRVLSVITLVSIAVALVSTAFAYFF